MIGIIIGYILNKKIKYIGPDSNDIVKEIHIDESGKKYKWMPKVCICPTSYYM